MKKYLSLLPLLIFAACGHEDGVHTLHVLTTNDVHGAWFDSTYVGGSTRRSLMAVNYYVDSIRAAAGPENVLLLDAGDCLQGDNAAYYYNYVDTSPEHLFTRLVSYMKYDAVTVGNHDIETGHDVYDRVAGELDRHGIPFLAGNAVRDDGGGTYFPLYKCFRRAGLKVAVLGYTNSNIPAWLDGELWSGMHFDSLLPLVQKDVDAVTEKEKPQVVIVSVHSATGPGDGSILEAQGLDLYRSLHGVDLLVCSHDHREVVMCADSIALLNTGNRAKYLGHGEITVALKGGRASSKKVAASLVKVDGSKADPAMRAAFQADFEAVRAFTVQEIGALSVGLRTRDAYSGMCDYLNLIHAVQLSAADAEISFAAPLTYNGAVAPGTLIYNDLFTIYPFENQLFKLKLKGSEIKDYLEYSYDLWLAAPGSGHVLNIVRQEDPRNNQRRWSFVNRPYNFDSAAGINYKVDLAKPFGRRVTIEGMADGTAFNPYAEYAVAMTSYRANGGGNLIIEGAGIPKEEIPDRIIGKYPEIRECIYSFIKENGVVSEDTIAAAAQLGHWEFTPQASLQGLKDDIGLLFGE